VYCLDRLEQPDPDFYEACARIPAAFGGSLSYARVDVRDARSLDRVVGAIADRHQRLDGVIAAAGVQQLKAAVDYTVDEVRAMMDVNYTGVFMTCASAARAMFKWNPGSRDGAMVVIASMSGSVANKGLICPVYNSSKAALLQLTRNLAMEWSAKGKEHPNGLGGIRVNSLSPGHILTPMVKRNFEEVPNLREKWERENMMGRLSTPEEFKGAGLFLLSKASSFMVRAFHFLSFPSRWQKIRFSVDLLDWLEPHHRRRPHCLVEKESSDQPFFYALFSDYASDTPSRGKRRRDTRLYIRSRFVCFRDCFPLGFESTPTGIKLLPHPHQITRFTTTQVPSIVNRSSIDVVPHIQRRRMEFCGGGVERPALARKPRPPSLPSLNILIRPYPGVSNRLVAYTPRNPARRFHVRALTRRGGRFGEREGSHSLSAESSVPYEMKLPLG
ncbi:D-arabinitol 2-dehydrogenase [ribulose-forming], partial [Diplodia seriata]